MNKNKLSIAAVALSLFVAAATSGLAAVVVAPTDTVPGGVATGDTVPYSTLAPQWREGEVIVKLRQPAAAARLRLPKGMALATSTVPSGFTAATLAPTTPTIGNNISLLTFDTTAIASVPEAIRQLSNLPEVEYAEPNYLCHILPHVTTAEASRADEQWGLKAIHVDELWQQPLISSRRPVIAIIDTGVDVDHPDLAGNIAPGGYDFVRNTDDITDPNGHGTHCAGIAAANEGGQVTGANPQALILPITVMDQGGSGDVNNIIRGINHAVEAGADIISLSLGGTSSQAYQDAINEASEHAIIVAAAGNSGYCMVESHRDLHGVAEPHVPAFPAAMPGVIAVMATQEDGSLAQWSNFDCDGPLRPMAGTGYNYELRVPGNQILSTIPGGGCDYKSGTSMACPLAAGAISRLLQCRTFESREQLVRTLIVTSGNHIDLMAAYHATEATLHPDTLHYQADSLTTITLVATGDGTAQVGDGLHPALTTHSATQPNSDSIVSGGFSTGNAATLPTELTLPAIVGGLAVTALAPHAFEGCTTLTTIHLPSTLEAIGDSAFHDCPALSDLYLDGEAAPQTSSTAFDDDAQQHVSLHLVRGYTAGFAAAPVWQHFKNWCEQPLRTGNRFIATIDEPKGTSMTFLIYNMERGYAQVGAGQTAIDNSTEGHLVIPKTVRGLSIRLIGRYAFLMCRRLKSIEFPVMTTFIDAAAFTYCDSLTELKLPPAVTTIGNLAFAVCTQLQTLVLPPMLSSIGPSAFSGCSSLSTIYALMRKPPYLPDDAFLNVNPLKPNEKSLHPNAIYDNARLLVPPGCGDLYAQAPGWRQFRNIVEMTDDYRDPAGIETIASTVPGGSAAGKDAVYTLQGQRVATTLDSRHLPPGIYIVNGRKRVVGGR